jgi:hypothetical protein
LQHFLHLALGFENGGDFHVQPFSGGGAGQALLSCQAKSCPGVRLHAFLHSTHGFIQHFADDSVPLDRVGHAIKPAMLRTLPSRDHFGIKWLA